MKISIIVCVFALFGPINCGYLSDDSGSNGYNGSGNEGFGVGHDNYEGGLRTIAQGSANRAHFAVSSQHAASRQASYVAKRTLARTAIQAAATAQAALAGKHVLLENLEKQRAEAHRTLEGKLTQFHLAKRATLAAANTAQQAANHAANLAKTMENAQDLVEQAAASVEYAKAEFTSKSNMVAKAKARLEAIETKSEATRADFTVTLEAVRRASEAAQAAQKNAVVAGLHLISELNGFGQSGSAHDEGVFEQEIRQMGHDYFR